MTIGFRFMIEVAFVHTVKGNVLALKKKNDVNAICHAYSVFFSKLFQLSLVLWDALAQKRTASG